MLAIAGIVVVFVMVFGGYILAGGKLAIILKSLPFELMMIGGAALGALLIGNSGATLKKILGSFGRIVGGPKWKAADYRDLLCLMFAITRLMKTKGVIAIEPHIENIDGSPLFADYPRIVGDHFAREMIRDMLRMLTMNMEDPHQAEEMIERTLEKHHHEALKPAEALQTMADGLPALGIVAAVLGVIKTMASITEPPEVLGKMIGGALVGTFLGVFLSYGLVGPMATRLKQVTEEEAQFYAVIRDSLVAYLHGYGPQVAVEFARGNVPSTIQPSFGDVEEATGALPREIPQPG